MSSDLNKIFNKNKIDTKITRNNINKNNIKKKITKYPLSPNISKLKNTNLNFTSRQKTKPFSRSPSMSSSLSNNIIKNNDNNLFKNKLKKISYDNINKEISRYKEKKNDSISLFDKLYEKLSQKSFREIKPLIFRMKSKRASSYSNLNVIKFEKNYNYKNKIKKGFINNNDIITSGSINCSLQDELSSEEIHFKAVKYYQDIKKDCEIID